MSNLSWQRPASSRTGESSSFRQRCASALTHPLTVAALAALLLNDVVFKSLWPGSWVTGKLSDLAWVVFALPLLAFLLSLVSRGNRAVERTAFLAAYIGLPLLYAAFNTFAPLHYWILRGLSLASSRTTGHPLDTTDSLVIPLGLGVAVWVWRRRVASAESLRLRLALIVAALATLASIASSPMEPDPGITDVGISADGTAYAGTESYTRFQSADGGLTWTRASAQPSNVTRGGESAETPRGRYEIRGADIVLVGTDGRSEVAYSARYLQQAGNRWIQASTDSSITSEEEITTEPWSIVYEPQSGNLIVAMGREGAIVGTPDDQWTSHAVGYIGPTDFSFSAKSLLLLRDLHFLAMLVAVSLATTGAGLVFSPHPQGDVKTWQAQVVCVMSLLASGLLLISFVEPSDTELVLLATVPAALLLGLLSVVAGWRRKRYWRGAVASLIGMSAITLLVFIMWLHAGIESRVATLAVVGLAILVAVALSKYVRKVDSNALAPCPQCQYLNDLEWSVCENCGMAINETMVPELSAFKQGLPAGFQPRLPAFLLDYVLVALLLGIVPLLLGGSVEEPFPFSNLVVPWAINLFYATILIGAFRATAGKRFMELYVVRSDGSKVGYARAFVRELLKYPVILVISVFMVAFRSDKRGLHDQIVDTVVIRR